ncbi:MAG: class I SAM-dependent methyltransferase [Gammaproteobacteria bacterium]|nr:class I SAM-dependent methyltransferase [Gammaproteobacteria bacterium]
MIDIQEISTGLQLGNNGIWYSKDIESISYPSESNDTCFIIEENSFWFKHRNNCITSVAKSYPPENNGTIFDIGGGNGFVSLGLAKSGFDVVLVEPGAAGATNAKQRGLSNVICATTNTAKFKPQSLPAVGLFDVIEHIEDDVNFLKSVRAIMKTNARLYVTVPSYRFLWSAEDIAAGHFRRYNLNAISKVLQSAGFQVEFSSYIFRFLPLPVYLLRTLPYKLGLSKTEQVSNTTSRDHAVKGGAGVSIFNTLLQSEINNLNNQKAMSFGGSCLLVAKNA